MSQADAQRHRAKIRADLGDEMTAHDPQACDDCRNKRLCLQMHYVRLADEMVERRMRGRMDGRSS